MSPEDIRDDPPHVSMDVYALGIMLFQMITGEVPFNSSSVTSLVRQHMMEPPPAFSEFGVQVSPEIEMAVRRALEKDPYKRIPSVAVLIEELQKANGISRTTSLPEEMPDQVEIIFTPKRSFKIGTFHLSNNILGEISNIIEYHISGYEKIVPVKHWAAEITLPEREKLYHLFYENKFDLIAIDQGNKHLSGGRTQFEGISLSFRDKDQIHHYEVIDSEHLPLSGSNERYFTALKKALTDFVNRYKSPLPTETALPKEMPDQIEIIYKSEGALGRSIFRISNNILCKESIPVQNGRDSWSAEISLPEQEKLYRSFYENKFDLIQNDKNDDHQMIILDMKQSIVLTCKFKDRSSQSYQINYGGYSILSGTNEKRYSAVSRAIYDLIKEHEPSLPGEITAASGSKFPATDYPDGHIRYPQDERKHKSFWFKLKKWFNKG